MDTPVSFQLAKLLKERGFDRVTISAYNKNSGELVFTDWDKIESNESILIPEAFNLEEESWLISAPTIAEVIMWLCEKHGIWISVDFSLGVKWFYNIPDFKEANCGNIVDKFNSPTEAYEAAIEYCLLKLIEIVKTK